MQFYNQTILFLLFLLPFIFLLFLWRKKRKENLLKQFANLKLIPKLTPFSSPKKSRLKGVFILVAVLFIVLALAQPQWGEEKKTIQRKGVDIVFVLDTSLSMLSEDLKPNRIDKARLEIRNFIKKLKGDRIALVAFAGSAFLQSPLTIDYSAFYLFLDAVKVGYIPDPGSSLANAINTAIRAFPKEKGKYKVIILFSDGEEHQGGLNSVIDKAKEEGVRIYTIGVGTRKGAPIPLRAGKNSVSGFKKNRLGQVVVSKLNDKGLEELAKATEGLYFPSTAGQKEIDLIYSDIQSVGKKTFKEREITQKEDHFQFFLLIAFLFLLVELFLTDRKKIKT